MIKIKEHHLHFLLVIYISVLAVLAYNVKFCILDSYKGSNKPETNSFEFFIIESAFFKEKGIAC